MNLKAPPGVFDILPYDSKEPWKSSSLWSEVEAVLRRLATNYNFKELRTPTFEETSLFIKGVGEGTDIVGKEMYTFIDKGERSLTLRPEGTAAIVRAYIENRLDQTAYQKYFYIGSFFRYERMQAGRFREFHQFGIEAYGNPSPEQDIEIIDLAYSICQTLQIKGLKVLLNSIGSKESRAKFREALIAYLNKYREQLSEESKVRLDKNPLRVLDSKDEKDQAALKDAPSILDYLSDDDKAHFEKVKSGLKSLSIPFEVTPRLVRGLDYYNKTVFEIVSSDLGSQNSLGGGGRYDGLVSSIGGPDVPSTGYAMGIERLLQIMVRQAIPFNFNPGPLLYIVPMDDNAKQFAMKIAHDLRQEGISVEIDLMDRKVGKAISRAVSLNATYITVIGENELKSQTLELKHLGTQVKKSLPIASLLRVLKLESEGTALLEKYASLSEPFANEAEKSFFVDKINNQIETVRAVTNKLEDALKQFQNSLKP